MCRPKMKTTNKGGASLLTALDVAAALSCSRSAVYALARRGVLRCVKIGGLIRFRQDDVDALLNGNAPDIMKTSQTLVQHK